MGAVGAACTLGMASPNNPSVSDTEMPCRHSKVGVSFAVYGVHDTHDYCVHHLERTAMWNRFVRTGSNKICARRAPTIVRRMRRFVDPTHNNKKWVTSPWSIGCAFDSPAMTSCLRFANTSEILQRAQLETVQILTTREVFRREHLETAHIIVR